MASADKTIWIRKGVSKFQQLALKSERAEKGLIAFTNGAIRASIREALNEMIQGVPSQGSNALPVWSGAIRSTFQTVAREYKTEVESYNPPGRKSNRRPNVDLEVPQTKIDIVRDRRGVISRVTLEYHLDHLVENETTDVRFLKQRAGPYESRRLFAESVRTKVKERLQHVLGRVSVIDIADNVIPF